MDVFVFGAFEKSRAYEEKYQCYAQPSRPGLCALGGDALAAEIKALKQRNPAAFVIVFPHWGVNYGLRSEGQRRAAKKLAAAGTDLLLGHGAHMMQEAEQIGATFVCYGLGNFVFNSPGRYGAKRVPPFSLIARLLVDPLPGRFAIRLRLYPIMTDNLQNGYRTRFVVEEEFARICEFLGPSASSDANIPRTGIEANRRFLEVDLRGQLCDEDLRAERGFEKL